MRSRLALALSVVTLGLVACSGAGNADLFGPAPAFQDTPADEVAGGSTPASPATPVKNDDEGATIGTPPSTAPDGGSPPTTPVLPPTPDAGGDPPPAVVDGCTQEREPNNNINRATPFAGSFCGTIDGASDLDFGRFVAPLNAKSIRVTHTENGESVSYAYTVNGQVVSAEDMLRAIPGAVYTVQARLTRNGNGKGQSTYRIDVEFGGR